MDPTGTVQLITVTPVPVVSVPTQGNTQPVTTPLSPQPVDTDQIDISAQAAQQPVQPKVQYANSEVLGTTSFSIYKDSDGQLVTRFFDTKTGQVTYIPKESQVLGSSSGNNASSLVNITA